jgi:nucleoside diphosphate kinase
LKRKAVLIIKPDFITKTGLDKIAKEFDEQGLLSCIEGTYKIDGFKMFSKYHRELEMRLSDKGMLEQQKKLKEMNFTIEAYPQEYIDYGIIVVIKNDMEASDEEFFQKVDAVKKNIRNFIKKDELASFVLKHGKTYKIIKAPISQWHEWKTRYQDNLGFAYFNGVHLEDYSQFLEQQDIRICKHLGAFDECKKIRICQLPVSSEIEMDDHELDI